MEASVVEAPVEAQAENTEQIFKWNTWVHIGPGATTCAHATDGQCSLEAVTTPLAQRHFHAWCRLPNQFAYRDIVEKAQAARARKMRELRDPDSDAYLTLEDQLDTLRENPEAMIAEINGSKWTDVDDADRQTREAEEFEHIDQDREELSRLYAMEEQYRDEEEIARLKRHIDRFDSEVEAMFGKLRERRADTLRALPIDELVDQCRKIRIEQTSFNQYMHVSAYWVWYIATMKPMEGSAERKFANINNLLNAPGEIVAALQSAFAQLEANLSPAGARAKNS